MVSLSSPQRGAQSATSVQTACSVLSNNNCKIPMDPPHWNSVAARGAGEWLRHSEAGVIPEAAPPGRPRRGGPSPGCLRGPGATPPPPSSRLARLRGRAAIPTGARGGKGAAALLTWVRGGCLGVPGGPWEFPNRVSHSGGPGMRQETPGLLPFLPGRGLSRLGPFLLALLPPPPALGQSASPCALCSLPRPRGPQAPLAVENAPPGREPRGPPAGLGDPS